MATKDTKSSSPAIKNKFGLELLRLSVGGDTESGVSGSKANAVIVLAHWRLLYEGFRCAGNGDTFSADKDISPPTEALPPGWNCMDDGIHALKYRHQTTNMKFLLKSFVTATESDQAGASSSSGGQHQTVILLRVGDDQTAELDVDLTEEVAESEERFKPVREDRLLAQIEDKLLKPLLPDSPNFKDSAKKSKRDPDDDDDDKKDPDDPRDPGRDPRNPRGRGRGGGGPPRLPDMPGPGIPDPDDPFGPFGGGPMGPGGPLGPGGPGGPLWDPVPGLPGMGGMPGGLGRGRGGRGGPRGGFPGGPRGGFPGNPFGGGGGGGFPDFI